MKRGTSGTLAKVPLDSIRRSVLDSALACGASALPNEFGGMLRSDEPGVITELLLLPGTTAGHKHANLQLFHHWGLRHLILGNPFTKGSWRAYNGRGEEVRLGVVEDVWERPDDLPSTSGTPRRPVHRGPGS